MLCSLRARLTNTYNFVNAERDARYLHLHNVDKMKSLSTQKLQFKNFFYVNAYSLFPKDLSLCCLKMLAHKLENIAKIFP